MSNKKNNRWIAMAAAAALLLVGILCAVVVPALAGPVADDTHTGSAAIPTTAAQVTRAASAAEHVLGAATTAAVQSAPVPADAQKLLQTYLDYKTLYDSSLEKLAVQLGAYTQEELDAYRRDPGNNPLIDTAYRAYTNELWKVIDVDTMESDFLTEEECPDKGEFRFVRTEKPEIHREAGLPVFVSEVENGWKFRVTATTEGKDPRSYDCVFGYTLPSIDFYVLRSFTPADE